MYPMKYTATTADKEEEQVSRKKSQQSDIQLIFSKKFLLDLTASHEPLMHEKKSWFRWKESRR